MKEFLIIALVLLIACTGCNNKVQQKIDLTGTWKFAMDPSDKGITEAWFSQELKDTLKLPGSLTSNGKGEDISLHTPWTGQIVDSSYFKNPERHFPTGRPSIRCAGLIPTIDGVRMKPAP